MPSVTDICNMALSRIGNSQRIDDLSEASTQAEQCSLFYEQSRDYVLREYDWGFATAYVQLAQSAVNPSPDYGYAYAMPTDCLKIRRIVNGIFPEGYWPCSDLYYNPRIPEVGYKVVNASSGRYIVTNQSPATLEYTLKVESPELFDPIFVSALAWKLASNIAPAIARDGNIASTCESAYRAQIAEAAAIALNEGVLPRQPESSFITGRD